MMTLPLTATCALLWDIGQAWSGLWLKEGIHRFVVLDKKQQIPFEHGWRSYEGMQEDVYSKSSMMCYSAMCRFKIYKLVISTTDMKTNKSIWILEQHSNVFVNSLWAVTSDSSSTLGWALFCKWFQLTRLMISCQRYLAGSLPTVQFDV